MVGPELTWWTGRIRVGREIPCGRARSNPMTPRALSVWAALLCVALICKPSQAASSPRAPKAAVEDLQRSDTSPGKGKSLGPQKALKASPPSARKRTQVSSSKARCTTGSAAKSVSGRVSSASGKAVAPRGSGGPGPSEGRGRVAAVRKTRQLISQEPYKAAIVMNAVSGEVLYEENPRRRLIPASLTKMMLTLVAVEELRKGRISLQDRVQVSEHASGVGGTQVNLKPGDSVTLEELLRAVLVRSANDAAAAVAEHIAGSQERCVQMMNGRATGLGMHDTLFHNVHGLPCTHGEDNSSTAYDMAILARELTRYPEVLEWSSQPAVRVHDEYYTSTNKLLGLYPGLDGLKTGYIRKSGFNMAATAEREGVRLVAVSMGSPSSQARFNAIQELLSKGFDRCQGKAGGSVLPVARGTAAGSRPTPYAISVERPHPESRPGAGS